MPHTLAEKILLAHCEADDVQPGNVVMVRYDEPRRRRVFPESPITVVGA